MNSNISSSKKENNQIKKEIKENSENSEDNNYKTNLHSSKKILNKNSLRNTLKSKQDINKESKEDFYHVNFTKISYYIFNYSIGYAELQKGHNYKNSQVTYLINIEKERLKHSNISNAKFMKGRKKVNIIKKEENEISSYNIISLKLKELYRALSTYKKESSIIKIFNSSIVIFLLILGLGFLNIFICNYIKNSIYIFFILIQKSSYLYQNLLFEIELVKEMLFVNNPYYNITMNSNKTLYFDNISKMIYRYYIDNTYIISNLTNNFNILDKEDEEVLTKRSVELLIIDSIRSSSSGYVNKKYSVLVYSAYREMNSALYHISKLSLDSIYQYDDNVYYFMRNGMSDLIMSCEDQMFIITKKFSDKIKSWQNLIIYCSAIAFFICCICLFIFSYFYRNIIKKRQNYLSIFEQLDINLIILFLHRCEKFINKLLKEKQIKDLKNNKLSNSSSSNYSDKENDNLAFLNINKKTINKISQSKDKKIEKNNKIKSKNIFQIVLFFVIFIIQLAIYIFYYQKINLYKNICTYVYYISIYSSHFIYIFIALKEYIFDKNAILYNQTVNNFLDYNLENYYYIFSQRAENKDIYRVYFPESYQIFLNDLHTKKICELIDKYVSEFPENYYINCNNFFYGTSKFGFFIILSNFVEEIRIMRDKIDYYFSIAETKNFVYNETYFNDPSGKYENLYMKYIDNIEEYKKYNPANFLNNLAYKKLLITFSFINSQIYSNLINETLNQFTEVFDKYNLINLYMNILFIIFIFIIFIFVWIPFVFVENRDLNKIKNMLSIIPSDILINVPDINNQLGLD